jgi:hypothetical protein
MESHLTGFKCNKMLPYSIKRNTQQIVRTRGISGLWGKDMFHKKRDGLE